MLLLLTDCNQRDSETINTEVFSKDKSARGNLQEFADVLRNRQQVVDEILKNPAILGVTNEFGFTKIETKLLPLRSGLARANTLPWSSWWFPKRDKYLFENSGGAKNSAPLEKYDLLWRSLSPLNRSAADFEREHFKPLSSQWEGLCDAWALAAISLPEPKYPVTLILPSSVIGDTLPRKVKFEVGDIKALLLKTFEATSDSNLKYFGQKFTGDESGWLYPDIFPEQFHRFVEIQLFKKKQAFIMDRDPGPEIWSVPVFQANYLIEDMPGAPNSVFVRTWLYSAESLLTNDNLYVGTREAVREYDYVLTGDRDQENQLIIKSGYWIKGPDGIDSRKDHPDYFITIPDSPGIARQSWNPEINIKLIDELLAKSQSQNND